MDFQLDIRGILFLEFLQVQSSPDFYPKFFPIKPEWF